MKNLEILITLLFIPLNVLGQNNYKEGYILSNENDTINAWINFRTDEQNQKECLFKKEPNGEIQKYLPGEILGYRFTEEGKYYISHLINVEGIEKEVFLEFMLQGMMNLYSYKENNQQMFFFEDADGKMYAVNKRPDKMDGTRYLNDPRYKGMLGYLFKDYSGVKNLVERANFDQKSMLKIAKAYHEEACTTGEDCIIFENQKPDDIGLKVKFSVYLGLQFFNYELYYSTSKKYSNSTSLAPAIGGRFDVYNPRWSNSFSFQGDVSFSRFDNIANDVIEFSSSSYNRNLQLDYKGYTFSGKLGIRYTYPKNRLKPMIEGGFSSLFLFGTSATMHISDGQGRDNTSEYKLRSKYIGYYVGVGLDYTIKDTQAIFLHFTYEGYNRHEMTQENGSDNIKLPQIKIGYTF